MLARFALPTLLATCLAVAPAYGQQTVVSTPSVVSVLPQETSLLIHAPNVSGLISKVKSSPLYAVADKPEFAKIFTQFKQMVEGVRQEAKADADVDPFEMLEAVKGEVVITFGNLAPLVATLSEAMMNMEEPEIKGDLLPFMIAVDTGSGRQSFKKNLLSLVAFIVKEGVGVKTDKFKGGKISKITPPDGANDGPEAIYIGELGTKFFFSLSKKFLQQTMSDLAKGSAEKSLVKNEVFAATNELTGKGSDFFLFVNIKPVLASIDAAMSANPFVFVWQSVSEILFGKSLNNLGMGYSLEENGIKGKVFVHNGGADDGILGWFKSKPFPAKPPTIIPDSSLVYATTGLNGDAIGKSIRKVLELVQSFAALQGEVVDIEQMFEQNVGVKFSAFLKSIGNRLHYFSAGVPTQDNPLGDFSFVVELKNDKVWKQLLDKALEMTGGALQPKKYMGRDIFSSGDLGGVDPSLCVTDKMLLFSLSPKSVEQVIRRIGKDAPGIGEKPSFKKTLAKLPAQVTGLSYSSKEYADQSAAAMKDMFADIPFPEEIPPELFDFLSALGKTMDDSAGYSTWKETGMYSETVAPYRK